MPTAGNVEGGTIFALSSGRPPAAIAVIRICGQRAGDALTALIGRLPRPRAASLATVRDPRTGDAIDEALALWFPGPGSETGEDMAELQVHGGMAVIQAVLGSLASLPGMRMARPGEFTRRAFENGRLDLTEVEGLADLIAAETDAQRRQAFRHLKGYLGDKAEDWRRRLIEALALVEAGLDFSDEGDVPGGLAARARVTADELRREIADVLGAGRAGERLRDGLVVAIAGPPNVGKSTLLNRIARRDVAIVSPYAGTTRDVIEVHLDLGGYPVTLLDTAGVRETDDPVEGEGIRRARERAAQADLVVWVYDAAADAPPAVAGQWRVANKIDLTRDEPGCVDGDFAISAAQGTGVDPLLKALAAHAAALLGAEETAAVVRVRHREALVDTRDALARALGVADGSDELLAEELRMAVRALGRLTGRVDVEDILDAIFRDFCIGK